MDEKPHFIRSCILKRYENLGDKYLDMTRAFLSFSSGHVFADNVWKLSWISSLNIVKSIGSNIFVGTSGYFNISSSFIFLNLIK